MKTLHEFLAQKGISQVQLAQKIGVSQPTIWAWLHGRKNPTIENLHKLADLTGLSVDALLDRRAA